ncbi:protein kinase [Streptomyces rimosus]|uniref:phosphotransferase family protein n=1 Tax=Streptomyces rimosus TaxID=1927 RepID=UPI0031D3E0C6
MTGLPDSHFRELIRPHTGQVGHVRIPERGFGSDFAAVITSEKGEFFVKAMFNHPGGRRDSILREKLINPSVQPLSPPLLWSAEGGWIILGFEAVTGRGPSFKPGSPDLPAIIGILDRIAGVGLPGVAREWTETRWDAYAANPSDVELFRGNTLVHADINPSNIMIGEDATWLVDWSWPTRGAGFIDAACLVVQLVSAGHSAEDAEAWVAGCAAWANADPEAIDAFAEATLRMYTGFAERSPDASWLRAMAAAARAWVNHRGRH